VEKRPPIFLLLLFLEEFILWQPGQLSTLVERFLLLLFKSSPEVMNWLPWLNPGLAIILFLIVVGPTVDWFRSLLSNSMGTNLILFMNRHGIIRIILAALVAVWILLQLRETLSGDVGSLADLYRNKSFWAMLFIGITAYKFVSPSKNA
jgi:hypothetical protein